MWYAAHVAAALAVVLAVAVLGRAVARLLRQPEVIGEIVVGLVAGPAAIALLGADTFHTVVLPNQVFETLKTLSKAGLVLFLVGLAHKLGTGPGGLPRRTTAWITAGALVPPLLSGLLLAAYVVAGGDPQVRGNAPLPAFLLMTAVAMSITAVPVMARILSDRGMSETTAGRLALASAIAIDGVGWLLLTIAIGIGDGSATGVLRSALALALGLAGALAVRHGLRTHMAALLLRRAPAATAVLLGAFTLTVAFTMEGLGMTAIVGAALIGFAIPGDASAPLAATVTRVTRAGRALVPAFFVVTGITVLTRAFSDVPWTLIAIAVLLGFLGKAGGGYAGARRAGRPAQEAARIGVLMNTRGLTELIVLQAGFAAGLLSAPLVLALIVMALVTTAATGPLLLLLDRGSAEGRAVDSGLPAREAKPVPVPTENGVR
ncbi:cation:proton antiporter [Streptomyces sp. NBC_00424]|uniref:cation:proton antiporter domain-containing protein n=1 Tax=Streptomyces sp. NBC_00424 TaxID=2903648 RepID=UPI0022595CEE|nr:cation:proton antiporter [Streptomyces sp. NBC_00424]MCX5077879.1 cation:proton antiporter [Streptomyces sp. NBC_00424]